jgi:hypothetical protein
LLASTRAHAAARTTADGKVTRWKASPVTVVLDSSIEAGAPGGTSAVKYAFNQWKTETRAKLPEFRFEEGVGLLPVADGVNAVVLAFIDEPGFEDAAGLTISQIDDQGGIREADVILNAKYAAGSLVDEEIRNAMDAGKAPVDAGADAKADASVDAGAKADAGDAGTDAGSSGPRVVPKVTARTLYAPHFRLARWGAGRLERGQRVHVEAHASFASDDSHCKLPPINAAACGSRYDLADLTTHEVGHFLGLLDDAEHPDATMYLCLARCEASKRDLSALDRAAIEELYADASYPVPESPDLLQRACAAKLCVGAAPGLPGLSLAVCALLLRRRRRHDV